MALPVLRKLAATPPAELRFRVAGEARKTASLVRHALTGSRWRRDRLDSALVADVDSSAAWRAAADACRARDFRLAHTAMLAHFRHRPSAFPIAARDVPARARAIRDGFPDASRAAADRADAIAAGTYDLLGYRDLCLGDPPDWHVDPVHGRRSPGRFWSRIPYLDPSLGDHKIIWELNRHQHWIALGRACALTGNPRYRQIFTRQLESWLAANPPLTGTNWASALELAFRVCSWLWSLELFVACADEDADGPWLVDLLMGADRQLRHIEENLSRYFSPNTHLSGEALALYVAGSCLPELRASRQRASVGRDILLEEAHRQIRTDGGHAELSAHYHRYSTDFYLMATLVARRAGDPAASRFEEAARRQSRYLRSLCDDAGRRPNVGDDDGGQLLPICGRDPADCRDTLATASVVLGEPTLALGPLPEETFWLCGPAASLAQVPARWPSTALPETGYYVSRTSRGDHLLFDAGPFGFLNGGHAHADALSCTLTVASRPLLIDPGTGTYTMSPEVRDRFRGPMMHNTLVIDGRAPSEPRGPFHWRSRTDARATVWRAGASVDYMEGTHEGCAPPRHTRVILALHGLGWVIVDHLIGGGPASASFYWHLHPTWSAALETSGRCRLESGNTILALAASASVALRSAGSHPAAWWSPVYGAIEPAPVICTTASVQLPWSAAAMIPAVAEVGRNLDVREEPLHTPPGDDWHGRAFTISWDGGAMLILSAVERQPGASDEAGPSVWGTSVFQTDARCAARILRHGTATLVAINGSLMTTPTAEVVLSSSARAPLYVGSLPAPSGIRSREPAGAGLPAT